MKRITLALAAVAATTLIADPVLAEPVSVRNSDGTVWVMQIQPLGSEAPVAQAPAGDLPIVEPAAIDLAGPARNGKPMPPPVPEPIINTEPAPRADGNMPADETVEVTAAKPAVESPQPPLPEAAVEAVGQIMESHGMMIIPQGCETEGDLAARYRAIYNAIPFNRAEYVANPAYRHDVTMELLTGQPRPTAGYTGRTTKPRQYTGYRPYIPSKSDYYRYRYPVGYGLYGGYGLNRLRYTGLGY